jgi:hypothetical protein
MYNLFTLYSLFKKKITKVILKKKINNIGKKKKILKNNITQKKILLGPNIF